MKSAFLAFAVVVTCLSTVSPAFALDDLGVVSGDTFELPGYNDGPSGGGVWPGSSGKGGDVGAMPLPNGVPAGGDIGGGPGSGPTGGDGPGADGGPKVDLDRPPYKQPKNRKTLESEMPFSAVRDGCFKPAGRMDGAIETFVSGGQGTQSAGPDDRPADELQRRRAETAISAHVNNFLEQVGRLTMTVRIANTNVFATERLSAIQLDTISRQYFDTLRAWEVLYSAVVRERPSLARRFSHGLGR